MSEKPQGAPEELQDNISQSDQQPSESAVVDLTPEQEKAKEEMIKKLSKGWIDNAIQISKEFNLPKEVISSPEVQSAAKEEMIKYLSEGSLYKAIKISEKFNLPKEAISSPEVQSVAKEGVVKFLLEGSIFNAIQISEEFNLSEEVISSPEVQSAAKEIMIKKLSKGWIDNAIQISKEFNLPKEEVRSAAKEWVIKNLSKGFIDRAIKISKEFNLPEEVISSPEVQSAAKEGVIKNLSKGWVDNAIKISKEFNLPKEVISSPEVQSAAKERMIKCLSEGNSDIAFQISEEFNLPKEVVQSAAKEGMIEKLSHGVLSAAIQISKEFNLPKEVIQSDDNLVFFFDEKIPLKYREEKECYEENISPEARRSRLTHNLSPTIYSWLEENKKSVLEKNEKGKINWEEMGVGLEEYFKDKKVDQMVVEGYLLLKEKVGEKVAISYANRPNLSHHDAYYFMKSAFNTFDKNNINIKTIKKLLKEVASDGSNYETGISHHYFATIMQNLENTNVQEVFEDARNFKKIERLNKLIDEIESSKSSIFESWKMLKKFNDVYEILKKKELLEQLQEEPSKLVRNYVEKLAFHPNIDMAKVFSFWNNTADFLDIDDGHTDYQINKVKKPSNYLSLPFLGLKAKDLRNALIEGSLDMIQTLPPMTEEYKVFTSENDNYTKPEILIDIFNKALGQRKLKIKGNSKSPRILFSNLQNFCKSKELAIKDLLDKEKGVKIIKGLDSETLEELQNILFDKKVGVSRPKSEKYRIRIGEKSDPEIVVAGNDTASCMPFGSGKNNVYMFNPNCTQLVVEREVREGIWKTAAQSIMTIDAETRIPTDELIKMYEGKDKHLKDVFSDEDFQKLGVITCDNIELAKNEEGNAQKFIRLVYERFFNEYLKVHGDDLDVDKSKVIIGTGYTSGDFNFDKQKNTYVPLAPMGYSDNIHKECYVIKTGLKSKEMVNNKKGITNMSVRDILAVVTLEGKAYHDNNSLLENLHGMQNNIIGMEIANEYFNRPNLSFVYHDKKGVPRGYLLAYEGLNKQEPQIYLSDLAVEPTTRLAGGRLINKFFETYLENYGTEKRPFIPVFTNARDKTSYKIIERQLQNLAKKAGLILEMEEVGQHNKGEDLFHDIIIYIASDQKELEEQKNRYKKIDYGGEDEHTHDNSW